MRDTSLSFLPFDNVWKMRIEHPYSLIVKEGTLAWSCGQCPLDGEGAVLFPGDLSAQAEAVIGFIERYLGEMGCAIWSVGQLLVYYVKTAPGDAARLKELFCGAFGQSVQVIPVAVPHFYYDGMLIEVDVFASEEKADFNHIVDEESGLILEVSDAGPFHWATVSFPRATDQELGPLLSRLLARANLTESTLLAQQWFLPVGCDIPNTGLSENGSGSARNAVRVSDIDADIVAELTFAKAPATGHWSGDPDGLSISLCMAGDHFYLQAFDVSSDRSLVEQTASIMKAVEAVFKDTDLSFQDVRKATTYYTAGSSADELHDNMSVRNRYYTNPGPASTGLPVEGLSAPAARVSINLFGAMPRHGG
ncbi:Rid family hydrolase [Ensifer adhaerens]|uniref:Rid family hydrolase n=1 Tax=Ensifer adhaerens TaxID=106592 RepID=UPI001319CE6F|nr:Rid family hydrolase [Ensifer adhaerens]